MISVVITTYKRPVQQLQKAIDSIITQSYINWELIIVNDYPEDVKLSNAIGEMIHSYRSDKLKYIVHEKNAGACVARNSGMNVAIGKYIGFLDDDDTWHPHKLEQFKYHLENSDAEMAYCDVVFRYNQKDKIHRNLQPDKYNNSYEALLVRNFIGSTSIPIMRLSMLKELGGFNPTMKACQDFELWLRIARDYKILYIPQPLVYYNFSEDCITKNIENRMTSHEKIIRIHSKEYKKNPKLLRDKYVNIACDSLLTNNKDYFYEYLRKSIKVRLLSVRNYMLLIKTILIVIKNNLLGYSWF